MKVILDYDENTGFISDKNGVQIIAWAGLIYDKVEDLNPESNKVDSMIKLVNAGFDPDSVAEMVGKGLL